MGFTVCVSWLYEKIAWKKKRLCDKVGRRGGSESGAVLPQKPPLPFQQGLIWRTRSRVPWALMSALHSTPPSQPRRLLQEPGPLTTPYSHKSFTPGKKKKEERRKFFLCWSDGTQTWQKGKEKHSIARVDKTGVQQTRNQCKAQVIRGLGSGVASSF